MDVFASELSPCRDIFVGLRGPPKGLLLFGPPGTGKTLIGRLNSSKSPQLLAFCASKIKFFIIIIFDCHDILFIFFSTITPTQASA